MTGAIIEADQLVRRYGDLAAVDGVSFSVQAGEIFGFLGPNGAGKSTTIKMMSTLLAPSAGRVLVDGHDVMREPDAVRRALGLLFQDPAVDDRLTGRENLLVHCMIYGVPRRERKPRIDEALAWIGLSEQADQLVRTFSGGMRRRLEVARALLHQPRVLVLDEPTTGLDPQTRRSLWEKLETLRRDSGLTIFMTTHYMDEAEHCDRLAIVDHGRVVAAGTPDELRAQAGAERVTLSTTDDERAAAELTARFGGEVKRTERGLELAAPDGGNLLARMVGFPVEIRAISIYKPSLEDAFIAITGRSIRADEAGTRDILRRVVRMRGRR